jgi:hypothetical protein
MPWYIHKELWTPLFFIGIRFFKDANDGSIWIKFKNKGRKRIIKKK